MGLFNKLLHKDETIYNDCDVVAAVRGKRVNITDVPDEIFAQQMMGKTIAIQPADHKIVSPMNGILEVLYPTGHAFAIRSNDGHGMLVHIGVNTVELKGRCFKTKVKQGDKVKAGEVIVEVDVEEVIKAGYDPVVLMINTEGEEISYRDVTDIEKGMVINK